MAKYVMLECNRLNSQSNYGNLNEEEDIYKNRWVNNVSSTGIEINAGDTIACESVAVNNVGASDEVMEFIGNTPNGYLDNKVKADLGFYVNHTGRNTAQLPLTNFKVFNGYEKTDTGGINARKSNYARTLGEVYQQPLPNQADTFVYTYEPNNPTKSYLLRVKMANVASTYAVNTVIQFTGGTGTGLEILVTKVVTEGNTTGIISEFQIVKSGSGYVNGDVLTDSNTHPQHRLELNILAYPEGDFSTKNYRGQPDGERYYFANIAYTGLMIDYSGSTSPKLNELVPDMTYRTSEVELDVPIGFNTPDNVGGLLTDILHKPDRITLGGYKKDAGFINPAFIIKSKSATNEIIFGAPSILQTPTYRAISANGSDKSSIGGHFNTNIGSRTYFYEYCAWANPKRVQSLSKMRRFEYELDNNNPSNGLFSGRASTQVANAGDLGEQTVGEYGLIPRLLNQFAFESMPPDTPNYEWNETVNYPAGGLIMTNIYFTEFNLALLQEAFRGAEEYWGDMTKPVNLDSTNYKQNLGVVMDIGLYTDEQTTNGFPLHRFTNGDEPENQRWRFTCNNLERTYANGSESATTGDNTIPVDIRPTFQTPPNNPHRNCVGNQELFNNYEGNGKNDNQQLPQLVVTSRWRDEFIATQKELIGENSGDPIKYISSYNSCSGDFNIVDDGDITHTFTGGYDGKTYLDFIELARKYDLAVVPVFPNPNPATGNTGTSEYNGIPDANGQGRPFIAFRSHFELNNTQEFNYTTKNGTWKIDPQNIQQGQFFGFDSSFIRNKAVLNFNLQNPSTSSYDDADSYNPIMYVGAVNPQVDFNTELSRYEIKGLNTPMVIGNGLESDIPNFLEASDNPEQPVYNGTYLGAICPYETLPLDTIGTVERQGQFEILQKARTLQGSQSGVSIVGLSLFESDNPSTPVPITNTDYNKYRDTLLSKMGFTLNQLLPLYGGIQSVFQSKLPIQSEFTQTYLQAFNNNVSPITTGAYISSAEFQPISVNGLDYPMYGLGGDVLRQVQPAVEQASLLAINLPQKLSFPYLCIYSSIVAGGTDTMYIGSGDGKQLIPCVAYLTRNYNQGDFFYGLEQSFNYTATKNFTITDITTDIRLPDGTRPYLQPHSSVIYKITKAQTSLPPPSLQQVKTENKTSQHISHDKERRRRIEKAI